MKRILWISYDLGVQGDYEGLYAWLDGHGAKECGDSLAFVEYEFESDLIEELKEDLSQNVRDLRNRGRIYIVRKEGKGIKGRFLFGSRKSAPWTGYATVSQEVEDSED